MQIYVSFSARTLGLLLAWKASESDEANKEELLYILEGLKLRNTALGILF